MKRRERWKERVAEGLEIPADLAYSDAIVTITGPGSVLVENYRCLLKYTPSEIVILTPRER